MKKKKAKNTVRVALIQMACVEKPAENIKKAVSQIKIAAAKGAKIVCLQELFSTRYFCQSENVRNFDLAQKIPGPVTEALSQAAKSNKVVVAAPVFEKAAAGIYYNSVVVIDADGKILGKYRKMHIP